MIAPAQRIAIIGATSAIALGVAHIYAKNGSRFFLVGRNEQSLIELANKLKSDGAAHCAVFVCDLRLRDVHDSVVQHATNQLGVIDVVLIAHGIYPSMELAEKEVDVMLDVVMTNAVSTLSLMHRFATSMAHAGSGVLAVLSSVAGERGRRNNYIYGATKAMLTQYASGLRASMAQHGVHVITIKPGPVDTSMTTHKNVPLKATVNSVAKDIVRGIETRKYVVYTPWFWRYIMFVVRLLPEWIFMRLKI